LGWTSIIARVWGGYSPSKSLRLDLPALIVDQRHGLDADIVQHGEVVEKGIPGLRYQDFAPRVAKQPEEEAVGLAGADGENNLLWIDSDAVLGIVTRNRLAGAEAAERLRIVIEGMRIDERLKQPRVVLKAASGWV
jgi:hypothetical protein